MQIELASLEDEKGEFAHAYAPGELVIEDDRLRLLEPPTVSGGINRKGRKLNVKGRVAAQMELECDRCLKPVEFPVEVSFRREFETPEDYAAQQNFELTEADLDLSIFDGEIVDIDSLVTEELVLAIPDHILCRVNCEGICPICGLDRNVAECTCETAEVDPRWAGLKDLRF